MADVRQRPSLPRRPFLYVLTDRRTASVDSAEIARRLFAAGVSVVQLRDKELSDRVCLDEAHTAVAAAAECGGLMIVNDRADIAALSGAHGIHIGDRDLEPERVRAVVGGLPLLGLSSHSVEEAAIAADKPIDYVALGPIYRSSTKSSRAPIGPEALVLARRRVSKPLVAIGGIGLPNIDEVVAAGVDGVAVVVAALADGDIERRTEALLERLSAF